MNADLMSSISSIIFRLFWLYGGLFQCPQCIFSKYQFVIAILVFSKEKKGQCFSTGGVRKDWHELLALA